MPTIESISTGIKQLNIFDKFPAVLQLSLLSFCEKYNKLAEQIGSLMESRGLKYGDV
jgi:hypothetical protein